MIFRRIHDHRIEASSAKVKVMCLQVDQEGSNFRTMETLKRTQAHLLSVMDRTDVPLSKIHHFLWDRYRGVRQDLFVQGYEVKPVTHIAFLVSCLH